MCSSQAKQDAAVLVKSFLVLSARHVLSPAVMDKAKAELLPNYYAFGDSWGHASLKKILCRSAILWTKWHISARAKSTKCIRARGWGLGNHISLTRQGRGWPVQGVIEYPVKNDLWRKKTIWESFHPVALKIKDISTHPSAIGKAKVKALSSEGDTEKYLIIHVPLVT